MSDPKDETEIEPPNARRVAKRAMILAAIVCRANAEPFPDNPNFIDLHERLVAWFDDLDVGDEMESAERDLIHAPLGTLDKKAAIEGTWRVEGLAILVWALGLIDDHLVHDEQVDPYLVTDTLYILHEDARELLEEATLRSGEELSTCRELHYAMHCRLHDYQCHRKAQDFSEWVEAEWLKSLGQSRVFGPSGDLRLGSGDLADADDEALKELDSILFARHRASIWLADHDGSPYAMVSVDT
jgi:hypothetical protein